MSGIIVLIAFFWALSKHPEAAIKLFGVLLLLFLVSMCSSAKEKKQQQPQPIKTSVNNMEPPKKQAEHKTAELMKCTDNKGNVIFTTDPQSYIEPLKCIDLMEAAKGGTP
ncbi:MAG: hypothetical protein K8H84_03195 [Sulfuricella denitrificans]|nr:hypothetical protein [Sulfuricella denitrificans]